MNLQQMHRDARYNKNVADKICIYYLVEVFGKRNNVCEHMCLSVSTY